MREFADLHLKPPLEHSDHMKIMIRRSAELGFRMVGLSLPPKIGVGEANQLRQICDDAGVEMATRVDLAPKTRHELLSSLRRLRQEFEIINVYCVSKVVARQAARDRRVDLLSFPVAEHSRISFDRAEAELASGALACLEIDMQPLLSLRGFARIRLLSFLRREVAAARSLKVPIVLSSGATNVWFLRRPQDSASLGMLFGLDLPLALDALSDTPLGIVARNKQKLSPDYIASGMRVLRRRDCCPRS